LSVATPTGTGEHAEARLHLQALSAALVELERELPKIAAWGKTLGERLIDGGRLLVAGNGGSAAQAQHLTGELVGHYRRPRRPLSALALSAETSSLTAIANDLGLQDAFARQVVAHGRQGDIFLGLSTSGRSANVVRAASAARRQGLTAWAITGPAPNELAEASDDAIAVSVEATPTVQEVHQVVIHLLCEEVESLLPPEPET
jgi:phosphoheptose isomerase